MPWGLRDALILFGAAWLVIPVIVYFSVGLIAGFVPAIRPLYELLSADSPQATIVIALIDAIGSLAILGYILRRRKATWSDLGFRRFSLLKALLYIGGLFLAFIFIVQLVYIVVQVLVPGFNVDEAQTNEFAGTGANMRTWALLIMVILPAFIEETVFRGFLFPAFSKRFGTITAAGLSSLLFGLAHFQPNVVVYTFVFGLILCFLYVRLGSIIPGMLLHMVNNYIAFLALNSN